MTSDAVVGSEEQLVQSGVRRAGKRLVPLLMLLYFVNYLDRVNIGFAGPNGMNEELGLSATLFGIAAGVFFIGYLLLEVPSNLMLHRFGARRWIARILVTWGIVATAMAFAPNATVLIVLRFLLGVAEAGFFPGIILYLTYWFPASHRARMTALFMTAIPISTALGSVVSTLIIQNWHGLFGLSGWRVMFLVEASRRSCWRSSCGSRSPTGRPRPRGCRGRSRRRWSRGSRLRRPRSRRRARRRCGGR